MNTKYCFFTFYAFIHFINAEVYKHYPEVDMHYAFYKNPLIWNEARLKCRADGANLAMPKNQNEAKILQDIFKQYPTTLAPQNELLIGFHDTFAEGEYITEKGDTLQYTYRNWYDGEPNGGMNENCGCMFRDGRIGDFNCNAATVYVCQKGKYKRNETIEIACPTSDSEYKLAPNTNTCYKLHVDPRPWAEARSICTAEGGYLAIINSKKEEQYLMSLIVASENNVKHVTHKCCVYLGFHDIFKEGNFVTVFGDNLYDVGYINWSPGNPSNSGGNENCGSLNKGGGLNDYPCQFPAPFLCEMDLPTFNIDARFLQ